jgi:hypothetical protein
MAIKNSDGADAILSIQQTVKSIPHERQFASNSDQVQFHAGNDNPCQILNLCKRFRTEIGQATRKTLPAKSLSVVPANADVSSTFAARAKV